MKRFIISLLMAGVVGTACADIQAPPSSEYTPSRKLGRAIANIIYSVDEIPMRIIHWQGYEGDNAAYSVGVIDGFTRMITRMTYGVYELATFWAPTFKCTYRPPYMGWCGSGGMREYNPTNGYFEFPLEIGYQSKYSYTRTQSW